MPITKASQNVITPNIVTTDTVQTITAPKVILQKYNTTSTTSLVTGTGSKSLTVGTGLYYVTGDSVVITRTAASTSPKMTGTVTSYNSATGALVVNVTAIVGSGTYASWYVTNNPTTALPALRITQDGSGEAIRVEDSTNPDSTSFVVDKSGNVSTGGSLTVATGISVSGGLYASSSTISGFSALDFPGNSLYTFQQMFTSPGQISSWSITDLPEGVYKAYVEVVVDKYYSDATPSLHQVGGYEGSLVFNYSYNTNNSIGYTVNNSNSVVYITTVTGVAQTIGGVPSGGYVGFQGTAASTNPVGDGTLTVSFKGHTLADGANYTYWSTVKLTLVRRGFY